MSSMKLREGFSLIEVIVAMLILSVGVLAMGASTGFVLMQVRAADLRTERITTVRQVAEQLRAAQWSDIQSACASLTQPSSRYTVECNVNVSPNLARVQLISDGPGFSAGRIVESAQDTLVLSISRPVQ